jgi:poly(A) polymerase
MNDIDLNLIPDHVLNILKKLQKHHFEAYIVGGCIRDLTLKRVPKDFDIATNAHPEEITSIFNNARVIGRRFKIVHIRHQREIVEVSTFRKKPSQISKLKNGVVQDNEFGSIEEDAERRDFTMNAIFFDPINVSFFDPFDGLSDIDNKKIKFIGNPSERIKEDPARLLRAIRFHAKLKFILPVTETEILNFSSLIETIPSSRIFDEIMKFFLTGHAQNSLLVLKKLNLIDFFFPHLEKHQFDKHSLLVLGMANTDKRVEEDKTVNPGFLMAVLLWDAFTESSFYKNNGLSLDAKISSFFNANKSSIFIHNRFVKYISDIWRLQPRFLKIRTKSVYRLSNHPRFRAAYDFLLLRCESKEENINVGNWWTYWQTSNESTRKKLLSDGIK